MEQAELILGNILAAVGLGNLSGSINEEEFKTRLIDEITQGLFGKWQKPWQTYNSSVYYLMGSRQIVGFSSVYGKRYGNPFNLLILQTLGAKIPVFVSISKVDQGGGTIIDRNKIMPIVQYFPKYIKDQDGNETDKVERMLRTYTLVTSIDNVSGMEFPEIRKVEMEKQEMVEYVENFLEATKARLAPVFHDQSDENYFSPKRDEIHLTPPESYHGKINEYYSTRFHESIHSTLKTYRCDRKIESSKWGDEGYALEELVAEMGSMLMCAKLGLEFCGKNAQENSKAYIGSWLETAQKLFDDDKQKTLLTAFTYASQAVSYWLKDIDLKNYIPESVYDRIGESDDKPVFKNEYCRVIVNTDIDKIQVIFRAQPKQDICDLLKDAKFGFSGKTMAWHGKNTAENLQKVTRILANYYGNSQPPKTPQSGNRARALLLKMRMAAAKLN